MSRKKSLSKKLSRRDPSDEELSAALDQMHRSDDRSAAILGAAMVENSLVQALQPHFNRVTNEAELFFAEGAPLGTFRNRIVMGYSLGVYDEEVRGELDVIRDVRNQFAHALLSLTFDNEAIASAVWAIRPYPFDFSSLPDRRVGAVRERYEAACWSLSMFLIRRGTEKLEDEIKRLKFEAAVRQAATPPVRGALSAILALGEANTENGKPADEAGPRQD